MVESLLTISFRQKNSSVRKRHLTVGNYKCELCIVGHVKVFRNEMASFGFHHSEYPGHYLKSNFGRNSLGKVVTSCK